MRFRKVIRRVGDGFEVRLGPREREVLVMLCQQLRDLLLAGDDLSTVRLFPPGYGDDVRRSEEYRLLTRDELLSRKLAAIELVEQTAEATSLTEDELTAWMGSVNSLRLVLGTQLDLDDDSDHELDDDDPRAPAMAAYQFLSWLLSVIVDALSSD